RRHFHILVRADGGGGGRRIGSVFPVEHHVGGSERLAVVPQHVPFELPRDDLAVFGYPAVLGRRNFRREDRNEVAIVVPAGERLVEDARTVLILGSDGEMRIEERGTLPPQHLERASATAPGGLVTGCRLRLGNARVHQKLA